MVTDENNEIPVNLLPLCPIEVGLIIEQSPKLAYRPTLTGCEIVSDLHGNCGDIMTQSSGNISSYDGDLDGKYDSNQNCVWTILAPSDKIIRLEFLVFELEASECEYDYVQV